MENYHWDKYWYLGFLGFVGFFGLPDVVAYFNGNATVWALTNLLWFLWFLNFLPTVKQSKT
ncbi:MAG: hypothetical protein AB8G11_22235 [Saprospiraceae bacterium]